MSNKDWTGDGNSIWKTLGASNHTDEEREQDDFYATDPDAVDKLLTVEKPNRKIWECAAGAGHLAERLKQYGYDVYATDIKERGYTLGAVQDFLKAETDGFNAGGVRYFDKSPVQIRKRICEKIIGIIARWVQVLYVPKITIFGGLGAV